MKPRPGNILAAVLSEFAAYSSGRKRQLGIAIGTPYDLEREQVAFEAETERLIASIVRKKRNRSWVLPKRLRAQVKTQARRWFEAFRLYIHDVIDASWERQVAAKARWQRKHPEKAAALKRAYQKANADRINARRRQARKDAWARASEEQKEAERAKRRKRGRALYWKNVEQRRAAARARYWADPEKRREAMRAHYEASKPGGTFAPVEASCGVPVRATPRRGRGRAIRRARSEVTREKLAWLHGEPR